MATVVRLSGDRDAAQRVANQHLNQQLLIFAQLNSFQNLAQNRRTLTSPNGDVMQLRKAGNIVLVDVYSPVRGVPPQKNEPPPETPLTRHWEDWDGECLQHTWEVAVLAYSNWYYLGPYSDAPLAKVKICSDITVDDFISEDTYLTYYANDTYFTGWAAVSDWWSPGHDPLFWYDLSGGFLNSSLYNASLQSLRDVSTEQRDFHSTLAWVGWYRDADPHAATANNKSVININIQAWYEGFQGWLDGSRWSGVSLTFMDVSGNVAVVYFKLDTELVDAWTDDPAYPQFAYQEAQGFSPAERKAMFSVGSGNLFIYIKDYGLTGDLAAMTILTESHGFYNDSMALINQRVTKYRCDYIDLL